MRGKFPVSCLVEFVRWPPGADCPSASIGLLFPASEQNAFSWHIWFMHNGDAYLEKYKSSIQEQNGTGAGDHSLSRIYLQGGSSLSLVYWSLWDGSMVLITLACYRSDFPCLRKESIFMANLTLPLRRTCLEYVSSLGNNQQTPSAHGECGSPGNL